MAVGRNSSQWEAASSFDGLKFQPGLQCNVRRIGVKAVQAVFFEALLVEIVACFLIEVVLKGPAIDVLTAESDNESRGSDKLCLGGGPCPEDNCSVVN